MSEVANFAAEADLLIIPESITTPELALNESGDPTPFEVPILVVDTRAAILKGILSVCATCLPSHEERAHLLTTWVEVGRLTIQRAVDLMNERLCPHSDESTV